MTEKLKMASVAGLIAFCLSIVLYGIIYLIAPEFGADRVFYASSGVAIGNFLGYLIFD